MSEADVYISAAEAASRLAVSGTGLRRLADIYAEVHGPLERDHKTNNRLWTLTVVERLEEARTLMRSGRAASVKDALVAVAGGVEAPVGALSTPARGLAQGGAALEMLAQRFEALERDNREMRRLLQEVLELNRALARQLEAPKDTSKSEPELARMNAYLLGELERRRLEDETKKRRRPWWRFW